MLGFACQYDYTFSSLLFNDYEALQNVQLTYLLTYLLGNCRVVNHHVEFYNFHGVCRKRSSAFKVLRCLFGCR